MHFTDRIVQYIEEQQLDLRHLTIILPSERAIKYISASFFKQKGKPLLAPRMITIDRWVRELSTKVIIDRTRLLVKLFAIQMENPVDPKDSSFDEFQTWGQTLLADFDEIDRYLLDPKVVFRNLADIREIENWSFNSTEPTPAQVRFMEFWDRLPVYYEKLNQALEKEGMCYAGKAYRELSEQIDRVFRNDKDRVFLFAGFNALSAAERSIMKQLHRMGRAHILIDADKYYLNDPLHEAGSFLRDLKSDLELKEISFVSDRLLNEAKEFSIIECVQQTGQVKSAASVLNRMTKEELSETLVLLADEALVVPFLRNIPSNVGKANISLGLPIRNTAIRTWIELMFSIQEHKQRFKTEALYFQDVQKIWNHPFVTAIMNDVERQEVIKLELLAVERNHIFRNAESLKVSQKMDVLLGIMAQNWNSDWVKAIGSIRTGLAYLEEHLSEHDTFNKALIAGFDAAVIDFDNITKEGLPEMNLKSFKGLLQQHWMNKSIAYHGNPVHGLQVMGLLETRLLDFRNIIVLGLNEGKMPPTNPIQTMIPMDLRRWLKLPTPREKQGLFAHHFYRLLHNCERMWVTYTSAREAIGSNEASRYLMQLELELARMNDKITWNKMLYSVTEEEITDQINTSVEKTPEMLSKMDEKFARSVSASALKKYLTCSLDFYYRYILEFDEDDDFEEELESRSLGTFIHAVLEDMYEPFARHNSDGTLRTPQPPALTSFDVEKMLDSYEKRLYEKFLERYNNDSKAFLSGKNLLSYEMAKDLTERILKKEIEFLKRQKDPVFIEYLELEIKVPIEVEVHGVKKKLQLQGFIDRIDSIGERIRIIDYKSGTVKEDEAQINLIKCDEDVIKEFKNVKHAVQLAMYSYIYREKFGRIPDEVGLISLINVSKGLITLRDKGGIGLDEITDRFPVFLQELLTEMYDQGLLFEHTKERYHYCNYCV
jgi:ATP-dependent helicase/nuclease subunit B